MSFKNISPCHQQLYFTKKKKKKKKITLVNILVSCGTCTIKEDDNADKYAFKSRSFIKSIFTLFVKNIRVSGNGHNRK